MTSYAEETKKESAFIWIIVIYPVVLLLISVSLNYFLFEINSFVIAPPSAEFIRSLIVAGTLLVFNHTWIMTATELVRTKFKIHSTPEEWAKSGSSAVDVSEEGVSELERHHDTHLNTTENTIYFIFLALPFVFVSPPSVTVSVWVIGYAVARLGYTYGFLFGKDGVRGFFMTLGLLAMYGMASYLVVCLFI